MQTQNTPEQLLIDTSSIKPNYKIPSLELAINEINHRISGLEKDLNERMNELELMVSANFSKHQDIIDELVQKQNHKDIYDILTNHKQALERLNDVI